VKKKCKGEGARQVGNLLAKEGKSWIRSVAIFWRGGRGIKRTEKETVWGTTNRGKKVCTPRKRHTEKEVQPPKFQGGGGGGFGGFVWGVFLSQKYRQ